MRLALWLITLFALAVLVALFAGGNTGSVTVFWPPYRIDLALNFALFVLFAVFVTLYLALRALAALFSIPRQAQRWRLQTRERHLQSALLESLAHLLGGRYIRARKAALAVLELEDSIAQSGTTLPYAANLRVIAHLLAAESAHALQDKVLRDDYLQQALSRASTAEAGQTRDGVQLRGARWALDDRDASQALHWLDQLSQGAARRMVALRLRFKAARLGAQPYQALEVARLLTKHRAFSELAGKSIARGLALDLLRSTHDSAQLQRAWQQLDAHERVMPDVALYAAQALLKVGGTPEQARLWLLPVWEAMARDLDALSLSQRVALVRVLEQSFDHPSERPDLAWLARIEAVQGSFPHDAVLQYLAGIVCMRLSLWGKAQQLLKQALTLLPDASLKRDAWRAMAAMAEQRQDAQAAAEAYRQAAMQGAPLE